MLAVEQLQLLAQRPIGAEHTGAFRIAVKLDLYGLRLFFRFDPRVQLRRRVGLLPLAAQRQVGAEHTGAFRIAVERDLYGLQLFFRFDPRVRLRRRVGILPLAAQRQVGGEHADAFRIFWRHAITRSLLRASGQRVEGARFRVRLV